MTSGSQFPLLGRAPRVEAGLLSRYTTRKPPLSFLPSITSISYAMQWCHNKTWNSRFSLAFSSPNRPHKKAQETNCMHNYGTTIPIVVVNPFFSQLYFFKFCFSHEIEIIQKRRESQVHNYYTRTKF